jgi:hypothetical protein
LPDYTFTVPEKVSSEEPLGGSLWDGNAKGRHRRSRNETANSPVIWTGSSPTLLYVPAILRRFWVGQKF